MLSTTLYFVLLLDALVSVHGKVQSNYVQKSAGILNVIIGSQKDPTLCHRCLVTFIGIERIHLVQASQTNRLYWVYGRHTNLVQALLSYCNTRDSCRIASYTSKSYISSDRIQSYQYVTTTEKSNMIENSIHLLAASIAKTEVDEAEKINNHPQQSTYDVSSSMRKQVFKVPLFFGRDLPDREIGVFNMLAEEQSIASSLLHQKDSEIANSKIEKILETESLQNYRSSMRCIIIPSYHEDAVCRECLAMHSDSLAIQTYFLYKSKSRYSAELCVLRSNHESEKIIENCKETFCSKMIRWESSECDNAVNTLAMQENGSEKTNEMHDDSNRGHKPTIPDKKHESLQEITQILKYLAYKRMAGVSFRKAAALEAFTYTNTLGILEFEEPVCIRTNSFSNKGTECISHILKNVMGAQVVKFLTPTNAIILMAASDTLQLGAVQKRGCIHVKLKEDDCKMYRSNQIMHTEMYKIPLMAQFSDEKTGSCHISYHPSSRQYECATRLRKFFSSTPHHTIIQILTARSLLVETSRSDSQKVRALYQNFEKAFGQYSCRRIQEVPLEFCSQHSAVLLSAPIHSPDQVFIHEFTKNRIPVGLWPPKNHGHYRNVNGVASQRSISHFLSNIGTELWPAGDTIAFVNYKCEKSKQMYCVSCLLQHTEVYLAYDPGSSTQGYVWMRPAPSVILKSCVGDKICSSLTYNADRAQIERPGELLQWTVEELR
ncbi:unnamed protein product [Albugo candida]|uniref:Uncharacterized protein n=1 Tax=Albugo candida TaxID=65357 RepID=A0A024FY20_9STRA|nr:unnamed protein product [Albugo candida]|eukprot:CCI11549.1 unnamed protein product [Albugo candida]